jgi:hypothetical protein
VTDPISIVTVLGTAFYLVGDHSTKQGYKNVSGNRHMQERDITNSVSTVFNNTFLKFYLFFHTQFI